MRRATLTRRSLRHYGRTNLAVVLGVAVGSAVLTGALIVGDSMRGSLREAALGRLGRIDHAMVSGRFFREKLAEEVSPGSAPVILMRGGVTHAETQARANHVAVIGANRRFWKLAGEGSGLPMDEPSGRTVVLNEPLADELGIGVGDDVLLRLGKPADISTETLLGRRDDTTSTLRLTVAAIVPGRDLGAFGLNPRQVSSKNAFVPLATLQRALDRRDRANALLAAGGAVDALRGGVASHLALADLGLRLRASEKPNYLSLESEAMLIEPALESAARATAGDMGLRAFGVQAYLANRIGKTDAPGGIPYSTAVAIDPALLAAVPFVDQLGGAIQALAPGEIILNGWAADDLAAVVGDRITVSYYITGDFGRLDTREETFTLRAIAAMTGAAVDDGLVPPYKGVTDTDNLADWDPPFPMDLKAVRDKDEAYWDTYHATPKAFITLADGERIWGHERERFGSLTSLRLTAIESGPVDADAAARFKAALLKRIDPRRVDLAFEPVREQLAVSSSGSTDFGGLFIGFSFFLIGSAAMLVALLFRLGVERRAGEVGLLLATGFSPRTVSRLLLFEGLTLAVIGTLIGLAMSIGYAWLMLAGLRSWWQAAVNTPFLQLHVTPLTIAIGFVGSVVVAVASIAWAVRGLTRLSARALLVGTVASGRPPAKVRRTWSTPVAIAGLSVALAMAVLPSIIDDLPAAPVFFAAGASMLTGCLALFACRLRDEKPGVIHTPGGGSLVRLGARNAGRRAGRSVLTAALIASATFLIAALQAFHMDLDAPVTQRTSGTGGYALFAESSVPLVYDVNTPAGRESLNVTPAGEAQLAGVAITPLRLRPGDESSCLNLYRPTKPRILGAGEAMIARGGFTFSATLAESDVERANPWRLLERTFTDGAVPVIGDESAVLWQLHLGLGKDLVTTDGNGGEARLRFVALLKGSVLQDELIVAEPQFERLFPAIDGYGFFLIEPPPAEIADVERTLERELAPFGFDAGSTARRLRDYLAVQNTYLSTFQTLGGFGLILGTIGLAAVLLRNVWERRGELALMRALGFTNAALALIVLVENLVLLSVGLLAGALSAVLAILPHIASRAGELPWLSLGLTLVAVFVTGSLAGLIAVVPTVRAPLLTSLRSQ